jgi:glycerol uptake facilitator-like aquaporin
MSGGHINPAVTFAMFLAGRIDIIKGLLYIGAQVNAGLLILMWHVAGCVFSYSGSWRTCYDLFERF